MHFTLICQKLDQGCFNLEHYVLEHQKLGNPLPSLFTFLKPLKFVPEFLHKLQNICYKEYVSFCLLVYVLPRNLELVPRTCGIIIAVGETIKNPLSKSDFC